MLKDFIYLDYAASSPMHPAVLSRMTEIMSETCGNPSSVHRFGRNARQIIRESRRIISQAIEAAPSEIIFTSGGTEGNNTVFHSVPMTYDYQKKHVITSQIEHPSVLEACTFLERAGWDITYLPVTEQGVVSICDLKNALRDDTVLVSIMLANNETGAIQPISEFGEILKNHSALFHVDAVQGFGRLPIDVATLACDFMTLSAHKIGGPKGVGALYVKGGTPFEPLIHGGAQERHLRAGTENLAGIAGFSRAVEVFTQDTSALREAFLSPLQGLDYVLNTDLTHSVRHILNISFPGISQEALLTNLDLAGIAISAGSACSAGSILPSHVLEAMFGIGSTRAKNGIRISFGFENTVEEVSMAGLELKKIVEKLRQG